MKDENKTKDELMNELIVLRQRISELEESGAEHKELEQVLQKERPDLGERVKELNCLYGISSLAEKQNISLEEMLQGGVDLIPLAWQYPEITCARITLENQTFRTKNYKDSIWKQSASITLHGNRIGTLEVCYLEEKPESDEGPFLKEERSLINAIATQLIKIIEREWAEEQITHLNAILRAVRNVNQLIAREKDRHRLLQGACDNLTETRGYYNAWIAFMDDSGRVVAGVEAALGKEFLPMLEQLKRGRLTNCAGRALGEPGVVAIEDPFSSCVDCPLREKYYGRGAITVRLESPWGKIYGLLCVSLPTNMAKNKEEQSLFQEFARDIAFALYNIELEEERKRMEEALEREKEKAEGYLNIAGTMLAIVNADENITLINKKGCEILGYNEGELIGRNWFDILVPGRIRGEVRGVFRKLMAGNIKLVEHYENPLLTKDGKERLIAFHNTVIRNPNGQIVGVLFSAEDITELKKAEEELEQSRSHFQMLFNVMADPVVIVDGKGEFLEITNRVQEITGFKREELLGKNFMRINIVTARSKAILTKNLAKRMMRMKIAPYEVEVLTKDGKKIPCEVNATRINYVGKPADMVVFRNITERKKAEKRIREYAQELAVRYEQLKVETEKAKESDRL